MEAAKCEGHVFARLTIRNAALVPLIQDKAMECKFDVFAGEAHAGCHMRVSLVAFLGDPK